MFEYNQSAQEASSLLRVVLQELGKHGLSPTPVNYVLFYERALSRSPSFDRAFDAALESEEGLNEARARQLVDEFMLQGLMNELATAQDELKRILRGMMLQMLQTGNEFASYASSLGNYIRRLDTTSDSRFIRELTDEVIAETRGMQRSSVDTQQRFTQATQEVEKLRQELEEARREATTDALTGLPNRRAFGDFLTTMMDDALKNATKMVLIIGDIDHFKQINDNYGHLVGDKVLRFTARTLLSQVKGQDLVCRFGGEEFAVILPQTTYTGGMALAEKLRSRIAASRLKLAESGKDLGELTISLGVACIRHDDTPESLIRRADRALYQAKHEGRNRVVGEDDLS
ncbi:MAG: GGDEF domain-containing protein [Halothiobacillaceae bacterium]|nr:GGDEF domain-containing protein [Halothiobacillaceae bacterium]